MTSQKELLMSKANKTSRAFLWIFVTGIIAALVLPIIGYWLVIGRVPSVSVSKAQARLTAEYALVDVRSSSDYRECHIGGAVSWPWSNIKSIRTADEIPSALAGRKLLFICTAGITSSLAAAKINSITKDLHAYSVEGGMSAWLASPKGRLAQLPPTSLSRSTQANQSNLRQYPLWEQWASVLSSFVVKPLYMLLAVVIIIWLRRASTHDLRAFKLGIIAFLLGEGACALNYVFMGRSLFLEYLHMIGMLACFSFASWAITEAIDIRLLHITQKEKACAAAELCGRCIKYADVTCGFRRLFLMLIPALMVVAAMPLFVGTKLVSYNAEFLGTPFHCIHPIVYQVFEIRICPIYGLIFLAASFAALLFGGWSAISKSKLLFAAGFGAIGFCFLRLLLFRFFTDDLVWMAFWEEMTELLFIAGGMCVLWVFRKRLLNSENQIQP